MEDFFFPLGVMFAGPEQDVGIWKVAATLTHRPVFFNVF
jgi:hypothetical protein